jgi:glyoxylase-like metal-dependent hydrolase (beta-lactamase superfamily II)
MHVKPARLAPAFLALFLLASPLGAQDEVTIETTDLGSGIYMLKGRGGNMGLSVGSDGAFLIDDQFAPLTKKILAAIAEVTDKPVEFMINTHWHGDHTGGNENMGKAGALLFAHENVRERLLKGDEDTDPAAPGALPVVVFTDALTFHWNDEEIHVFHVHDAHTDGDAMIHFRKANVIHVGDVYFNGLYPFIDTESGGSTKGIIAAVDKALALADADTKIIPGHGALSNRAELEAYRNMLATIVERIEAAIAEGKNLDEVQATKPSAEWDEVWGEIWIKPDEFVETIYNDFSSK